MKTMTRPGTFPGNTPANRSNSAVSGWMIRILNGMIWNDFLCYLRSTRGLLIRRSRVRDPPGSSPFLLSSNPRTRSVGFRGRIRGQGGFSPLPPAGMPAAPPPPPPSTPPAFFAGVEHVGLWSWR